MVILSRKVGQKIYVGGNVVITVTDVVGDKVRVAVEAPADVPVERAENMTLPQAQAITAAARAGY